MEKRSDFYTPSRPLAALLSLGCIGLGYIYGGRPRRAALALGSLTFFSILFRSQLVIWGGPPVLASIFIAMVMIWLLSSADSAVQAGTPRPRAKYNRSYFYLGYYFLVSAFLLALLALLRLYGSADAYHIPANSMAPTIIMGDSVMVNKSAYRNSPPLPGDLAIFLYPKDKSVSYVKRVMAGPGETVEVRERKFFLNGKELPAKKLSEPSLLAHLDGEPNEFTAFLEELGGKKYAVTFAQSSLLNSEFGPVTIPPGHYFTLGDHRDRSSDSRMWGSVPLENFVGRPEYIYFSRDPESGAVRWHRIGKKLE